MMRSFPRFLAAVFAIALFISQAKAGGGGSPPNAGTPILIGGARTTLGQSIGSASSQVWRDIATRVNYPNLAPSDGYKQTNTSRLYYPLATRGQISATRYCYANFGYNGVQAYENNATTPMTITASVEFNTTTPAGVWFPGGTGATQQTPLTFNGQSTVTLPVSGAPVCSDPVYYPYVSPMSVYVWTYVSVGDKWVANHGTRGTYRELVNDGYYNNASASLASNTTLTFTIAPTSTTSASLLPLVGPISITGAGITGAATATCAGGTAALTGTGLSSGSVVCATGVVTLNFGAAQSGVYTYTAYGTTAAADETQVFGPADMTQPYTPVFGPSSIEAQLAPSSTKFPYSILGVGDSIITGIGGSDTSLSFLDYSVQSTIGDYTTATIGIEKISQPAETLNNAVNPLRNYRRLKLAGGRFDEVVSNYGTNDISSGPSLASIQANYLALWSLLAQMTPNGYKDVYQTSILPRTVSNVSQSPFNANFASGASLRNQVNAWLCTQVGVTIGGLIDVNLGAENAPGTCAGTGDGQWKSLSYVSDGTHPTDAGRAAIAGVVGVAGSNPSPAFVGR
jgi:lysophospholipase L1-like esterase